MSHPASITRPAPGVRAAVRPDSVLIGVLAVVGAVVLWGAVTTPGFVTVDNLKAVLLASAFVGTIAVGATAIMLSGNLFSLSLGITTAVTAMAFLYGLRWGLPAAIAVAIGLGATLCVLQGVLVGALDANPIIVTIGAGALQAGAVEYFTGGQTVYPAASAGSYDFLSTPVLFGVAFPFYAFLATAILVHLLLRRTAFGRQVYLVGENRAAARAAGIGVTSVCAGAFAVAGACAGIAGVLLGAFNDNATLTIEGTLTFDVIAAILVGGSLVSGGHGSALRTFVGAIVIAALSSLMLQRGYSTGVQILVTGVIVLGVVLAVHVARREAP